MLSFWVVFAAVHIISFFFYFFALERVREYTRPYLMLETRETKLFGFLSIRKVFILYFLSIIVLFILELPFVFFSLL
jgi:hypothetical protein